MATLFSIRSYSGGRSTSSHSSLKRAWMAWIAAPAMLSLLVLLGVQLSAQEMDDTGTATAAEATRGPNKEEVAESRYEAANVSSEAEKTRIAIASSSFSEDALTTPLLVRPYLVSFRDPVSVVEVLRFARGEGMEVEEVFTWIGAPGAVEVGTGSHSTASLGWPGVSDEDVGAALARFYAARLSEMLEAIAQASNSSARTGPEGGTPLPSLQTQAIETEAALRLILAGDVPLYGMRCLCSPSQLQRAEESVAQFALRAVEPSDSHQFPIWPTDLLRTLILQSGGTYGL